MRVRGKNLDNGGGLGKYTHASDEIEWGVIRCLQQIRTRRTTRHTSSRTSSTFWTPARPAQSLLYTYGEHVFMSPAEQPTTRAYFSVPEAALPFVRSGYTLTLSVPCVHAARRRDSGDPHDFDRGLERQRRRHHQTGKSIPPSEFSGFDSTSQPAPPLGAESSDGGRQGRPLD